MTLTLTPPPQGSACRGHLACLVAAQRGNEMVGVQNTPTISDAGLAAFRATVLVVHAVVDAVVVVVVDVVVDAAVDAD